MENQRKFKRRHLIYYLRVFDNDSGVLLGHLVDITKEGIMLISEEPIQLKNTFSLRMVLPDEIMGKKELIFDAESKWSKADLNPDFVDTGFQLKNIDEEDIAIIEDLIEDFLFADVEK